MRKNIEWCWENLDLGTRRAKIMGGWLVNTHRREDGKNPVFDQALVFIPDRDHEWSIHVPVPDPQIERSEIAKDFELKD